jgi:hypothetical protein
MAPLGQERDFPMRCFTVAALAAISLLALAAAGQPASTQPASSVPATRGAAPSAPTQPAGLTRVTRILGTLPADAQGGGFTDDGRHCRVILDDGDKQRVFIDGILGPAFDAVLQEPGVVFLPDGRSAYQARRGDNWHIVLDGKSSRPVRDFPVALTSMPDGAHVWAVAQMGDERQALWLDGELVGEFAEMVSDELVFSQDGRHWACIVRLSDDEMAVLRDGRIFDTRPVIEPAPDEEGDISLRLSANGRHIVYIERKGNQTRVVRDGDAGPFYDGIDMLITSDDGRHYAYVARMGEKWIAVADGQPSEPHEAIALNGFDAHGDVLMCYCDNEQYFVRLGEASAGPFDEIRGRVGAELSPGRREVCFAARRASSDWVVVQDWRQVPVHAVAYVGPFFSVDDTSHCQFGWARDVLLRLTRLEHVVWQCVVPGEADVNNTKFQLTDGVPGPRFGDVYPSSYTPDGRHWAYIGIRFGEDHTFQIISDRGTSPDLREASVAGYTRVAGGWEMVCRWRDDKGDRLVMGGKQGRLYEKIEVAIATGQHVLCAGRGGGMLVVELDGREVGRWLGGDVVRTADRDTRDDMWGLANASPDGGRTAMVLSTPQGQQAIIDGRLGPLYEQVGSVSFSDDGRHYAYCAQRDRKWHVIIEGYEAGPYDSIPERLFWQPDGRLEYVAIVGDHLVREVWTPTWPMQRDAAWRGVLQWGRWAQPQHAKLAVAGPAATRPAAGSATCPAVFP